MYLNSADRMSLIRHGAYARIPHHLTCSLFFKHILIMHVPHLKKVTAALGESRGMKKKL